MKLYIGNGFWKIEEIKETIVPTTDNDFYFLIPSGSPNLFRAIKVENEHILFWENEENGKVDNVSFTLQMVNSAFKNKMWVKQGKVPNESKLLTVTIGQAKQAKRYN